MIAMISKCIKKDVLDYVSIPNFFVCHQNSLDATICTTFLARHFSTPRTIFTKSLFWSVSGLIFKNNDRVITKLIIIDDYDD